MTEIPMKTDSLLVTHMPNVRYLTGFSGSSGCALITRRQKLFFTDFRYRQQSRREVRGYQVHVVNGGLLEGVCAHIKSRRLKLAALGLEYGRVSHADYLVLKRLLKGIRISNAGGAIEMLRQRKDPAEVRRIRNASAIADRTLGRFRRHRITGKTEGEVAWLLESLMREAGSGPLPFEIIVASGPRSAMPHGVAGERVVKKDELVVIDMGASVDGYCCDITRTFATGRLSPRQKKIYEIVRESQQKAFEAVKPGAECSRVDAVARELIDGAGFGDAFGHSLGHGVGLEAHEGPVLSAGSKAVLEPGMCVTIEPGIYAGRSGVRIEDTVLVNHSGAERLTKSPRRLITLR
jgi:Xaa-Pro aminopeptidase